LFDFFGSSSRDFFLAMACVLVVFFASGLALLLAALRDATAAVAVAPAPVAVPVPGFFVRSPRTFFLKGTFVLTAV